MVQTVAAGTANCSETAVISFVSDDTSLYPTFDTTYATEKNLYSFWWYAVNRGCENPGMVNFINLTLNLFFINKKLDFLKKKSMIEKKIYFNIFSSIFLFSCSQKNIIDFDISDLPKRKNKNQLKRGIRN